MKNIEFIKEFWNDLIEDLFYSSKQGKIETKFNFKGSYTRSDEKLLEKIKVSNVPEIILDFYQYSNGCEHSWNSVQISQAEGKLYFIKIQDFMQDWKDKDLYTNDNIVENGQLKFYRPLQVVSETISCGIINNPDFTDDTMYLHHANKTELHNLGVNFKGYLKMAGYSKFFKSWPLQLIDLKNDNLETERLKYFELIMTQIFKDFSFLEYLDNYNSLALDKPIEHNTKIH